MDRTQLSTEADPNITSRAWLTETPPTSQSPSFGVPVRRNTLEWGFYVCLYGLWVCYRCCLWMARQTLYEPAYQFISARCSVQLTPVPDYHHVTIVCSWNLDRTRGRCVIVYSSFDNSSDRANPIIHLTSVLTPYHPMQNEPLTQIFPFQPHGVSWPCPSDVVGRNSNWEISDMGFETTKWSMLETSTRKAGT